MRVINKTTGILEYQGHPMRFQGIEYLDTVIPESGKPFRRNDEYEIIYTPVEQAEIDQKLRKEKQLAGVEFQGVMCSATSADQDGLSAVFLKNSLAKMAGKTLPDVYFRFENGNTLTLNAENIDEMDAVWTPFRLSFFPPPESK